MCMFCRSLFVLLYFFSWPLCCLFFFYIRIPITPLVSSSFSSYNGQKEKSKQRYKKHYTEDQRLRYTTPTKNGGELKCFEWVSKYFVENIVIVSLFPHWPFCDIGTLMIDNNFKIYLITQYQSLPDRNHLELFLRYGLYASFCNGVVQ